MNEFIEAIEGYKREFEDVVYLYDMDFLLDSLAIRKKYKGRYYAVVYKGDFTDIERLKPQFHALLDNLEVTWCLFKEVESFAEGGEKVSLGIIPNYAQYTLEER